jgi:hypothetical protein
MFRFSFLITLLIFFSCSKSRFSIDDSEVEIQDVKLLPLTKDLFSMDTSKIHLQSTILQDKYGTFFEKFVTSIVNDGGLNDSTYGESLKHFISDSMMRRVVQVSDSIFDETTVANLEKELTSAFRRMKFYFPDSSIPKKFVMMMSGFNYRIVNVDETSAFSTEFYLGRNSPFYQFLQPPIPNFKRRLMENSYVLRDIIYGWVRFKFSNNNPENNLLELMLKEGKLIYLTKAANPEMEDSVLMGYTSLQMEYCENFERDIWKFFSEKNRLFVNDMKEMATYAADGPFTAAISKDCPPFIANYIGYRIIHSYMENNTNVSFAQLMLDSDYQKILAKAKYKPD